MKEKFIVEGANWEASIMVDTSIHETPHFEAATQAFEIIFGKGADAELSDEFDVIMKDEDNPNLGLIVCCFKESDRGSDDKTYWILSRVIAENAGLDDLAKEMFEIEKQIIKRSHEEE